MEYEKEILVYNHNKLMKLLSKNIGMKHLNRWLLIRSIKCENDKRINLVDSSIHSRTNLFWGNMPPDIKERSRQYRKTYFGE